MQRRYGRFAAELGVSQSLEVPARGAETDAGRPPGGERPAGPRGGVRYCAGWPGTPGIAEPSATSTKVSSNTSAWLGPMFGGRPCGP